VRLYHGTSGKAGKRILQEGIQPRSDLGNWEDMPSNPDAVYLTDAYAPYFAAVAAHDEDEMAIVEVESDRLNEVYLCPDEDYLEQGSRNNVMDGDALAGLRACGQDMHKRTAWFRDHILAFQGYWMSSIQHLGTCCYLGSIEPDAITRVTFIKQSKVMPLIGMAMDPSISLLNYQICGAKYRALTQWFAGRDVDAKSLTAWGMFPQLPPEVQQQAERECAALQRLLSDQSMIRTEFP